MHNILASFYIIHYVRYDAWCDASTQLLFFDSICIVGIYSSSTATAVEDNLFIIALSLSEKNIGTVPVAKSLPFQVLISKYLSRRQKKWLNIEYVKGYKSTFSNDRGKQKCGKSLPSYPRIFFSPHISTSFSTAVTRVVRLASDATYFDFVLSMDSKRLFWGQI